ncbi:hypothetical protein A5784_00875 [Mycobacterium sp. 852013-50091_SCH5140682]|uniref:hypothetical protein n=1 Tax=Mycobacterium sp. 852013-50091_SCH5140682 TaxID=1834109 RepID=UPI0007EA1453|nr:hypothetical protein [Mycobacterium sp. 852013-50091_SCH5140682]OBC09271.1 hypothetical protein A5784_00875 [Mycobacterium sp. 852013-50091_SCH5140682]
MILRRTAVGAALIAAPLAFAAPAMAKPSGMNFDCAPCVGDINNDGKNDPVWNEVTSFGPWETVFDGTNGTLGDKKGAWESGVEAINGGAWEKAFPPAE